jgi:putative Holliday junction resolvase
LNELKKRIIGLDVGEVRVGVSVSNPERTLAVPLGVFERARGVAEREVIKLVHRDAIELIVLGLPLSDDGSENPQCERIRNFGRRLQKRCDAEIQYSDEFLSSVEAKRRLREAGKKEEVARKKGIIDAVAATILLQAYLDNALEDEEGSSTCA